MYYEQRLARGKHEGMYFWRDYKGLEVDLIIEDGQTLRAYEIKAGRTANASFFTNLMAWEKLSGSAIESTVIYGGDISQ